MIPTRIEEFADRLAALDDHALDRSEPLPPTLRMGESGGYSVYYAPFDHVNRRARVVLVGITPGRQQAVMAIKEARRHLKLGAQPALAAERAKAAASFGGTMRRNLVEILDHIGLAQRIGVASCDRLWTDSSEHVHFTSALRYPVFEGSQNFSGARIAKHPFLREQIEAWFSHECKALPQALFVPLGPAATEACDMMVGTGALSAKQVLAGVPHPSGANAERIAYFVGRKARDQLSAKTDPAKIDSARAHIIRRLADWN